MKKIAKLTILLLISAYFLGVCPTSVLAGANKDMDKFEKRIDKYVDDYESGLVSCQVAIFDEEGIDFKKAYGYKDIENKIKADTSDVYEWGSCSKLLVWVSVMQLYEQGKLDLDADIRTYLPEGFLTKLQYPDEKISMKNLMSHNAGFQESFYENQMADQNQLFENLHAAVKYCECYQSYHVGDYTAYSNWGTALAAYIVEQISGEDYVSYVHNHIFKVLNMKHTAIDPRISDNDYVRDKRNELKCYYRGEDRKDDIDLGVARSYVQLYPAGSCVGTLDDFAKFGQAFVSSDNPLFDKEETRKEMFEPTSFYTNTDINKNCHGLRTSEYGVQVLGHAGNTMGCSSNLIFDPVSKIGMVVMTNEPGETLFNYGLGKLVFASPKERYDIRKDDRDISGFYTQARTIEDGLVSFQKYIGGILPLKQGAEGNYSLNILGLDIGQTSISKIGESSYLMENASGMEMFIHSSLTAKGEKRLEMMSTDYVYSKSNLPRFLLLIMVLSVGFVSIVILVIKLIIYILMKVRNKLIFYSINITGQQIFYDLLVSFITIYLSANIVLTHNMTTLIGLSIGSMAVLSIINGYKNIKYFIENKNSKTRTKIHYLIWAMLSFIFTLSVCVFNLYNYWKL